MGLGINSRNAINWLRFLLLFYPFTDKERYYIKRFIFRNDKKTRTKELERIFGDDYTTR